MSGVTIRRGEPGDLERVMAMASESETAARWRPADYEQIFQTKRILFVAEEGYAIVGFVVAQDIAGEWELENIAVKAAQRRRGIAKTLMQALMEAAEKRAAKSIFLEVRESNSAAMSLYEGCGFQQYGRRKSYYANPSEDGLLYRFLCSSETRENC